jgi:uncharacterized protein
MHPTSLPIVCRRAAIEFDSGKAPTWHAGPKEVQDLLNALSFLFPPAEKFCIQTVERYQDRITDPALRDQVKRFIFQEAMHATAHARCNVALSHAVSYGVKIEKYTAAWLTFANRISLRSTRLARSCALEHLTSILADTLLRDQEAFLAQSEPAFAALWLWHAVEETEHKGVCFDVYQTVVGRGFFSYLHRVVLMGLCTIPFLLVMHYSIRQMRKAAATQRDVSDDRLARGTAAKASESFNFKKLIKDSIPSRLYFDYYRPSFHPWNHDNSYLVDQWKRRYRDFSGIAAVAEEAASA